MFEDSLFTKLFYYNNFNLLSNYNYSKTASTSTRVRSVFYCDDDDDDDDYDENDGDHCDHRAIIYKQIIVFLAI